MRCSAGAANVSNGTSSAPIRWRVLNSSTGDRKDAFVGWVTVRCAPRSSKTSTYAAGRGSKNTSDSPSTRRVDALSAISGALRRRSVTPAAPRAIVSASAAPKNAAMPSAGIGTTVPGVPPTTAVSGPSSPDASPATTTTAAPAIAASKRFPRAPSAPRRAPFAYATTTTNAIASASVYCHVWYSGDAGYTSCATTSAIAIAATASTAMRPVTCPLLVFAAVRTWRARVRPRHASARSSSRRRRL